MTEMYYNVKVSTEVTVKAKDEDKAQVKAWEVISEPDFGDDEWDHEYTPSKENWRYCETCRMIFDFWKYDSLADTGHDGHKIRKLTDEEYEKALKDCEQDGCFEES